MHAVLEILNLFVIQKYMLQVYIHMKYIVSYPRGIFSLHANVVSTSLAQRCLDSRFQPFFDVVSKSLAKSFQR